MTIVDRLLDEVTNSQRYVLENIVFRLAEEGSFLVKYDDLVAVNNVNKGTIRELSKLLRLTLIIDAKHHRYEMQYSIVNSKRFKELEQKINME